MHPFLSLQLPKPCTESISFSLEELETPNIESIDRRNNLDKDERDIIDMIHECCEPESAHDADELDDLLLEKVIFAITDDRCNRETQRECVNDRRQEIFSEKWIDLRDNNFIGARIGYNDDRIEMNRSGGLFADSARDPRLQLGSRSTGECKEQLHHSQRNLFRDKVDSRPQFGHISQSDPKSYNYSDKNFSLNSREPLNHVANNDSKANFGSRTQHDTVTTNYRKETSPVLSKSLAKRNTLPRIEYESFISDEDDDITIMVIGHITKKLQKYKVEHDIKAEEETIAESNMSLATFEYMQRYGLLKSKSDGPVKMETTRFLDSDRIRMLPKLV